MDMNERLQKIIRDVFDDESLVISDEMTANDVEAWDSLNHVVLIAAIEREFNVRLKTQDVLFAENLGQIKRLLATQISG